MEQQPFKDSCISPAGTLRKVQEFSADHHSSTYIESAVALEGAVMDLNIRIADINSTALKVGCPPAGT
jgi:hypothetical protein